MTNSKINEFLSFVLDKETYAVNVECVREVLEFSGATRVPRTPEFMRGVINLRGSVVPIIDMRIRFGLERVKETVDTCVVVVEIQIDSGQFVIGALVDAVMAVQEILPDAIEPPPNIGTRLNAEFIKGMAMADSGFIIILDMDKTFAAEDLTAVAHVDELAEANGYELADMNSTAHFSLHRGIT